MDLHADFCDYCYSDLTTESCSVCPFAKEAREYAQKEKERKAISETAPGQMVEEKKIT